MHEPTIAVHLHEDEVTACLVEEVRAGFAAKPYELPPKWFYDERGSRLFDEITRLAEYYPTRTEQRILDRHAADIAALTRADTVIELGSGTSTKTRTLLDAFAEAGALTRFVPFDVSAEVLTDAAQAIAERYRITVDAVVGDFHHHLDHLPTDGRRVIAFLGGTIGNFYPEERRAFLSQLRELCGPDGALLVGTDLVKDRARLLAAYDDAGQVTAAFNRNVLRVVNRRLDADFDETGFEHVARFDEEGSFIEMALAATTAQRVRIEDLDMTVEFDRGDEIRTEISTKFTLGGFADELAVAGFGRRDPFCDPDSDFALWLARP